MKRGGIDPLLVVALGIVVIVVIVLALRLSAPPEPSLRSEPQPVVKAYELDTEDAESLAETCRELCTAVEDDQSAFEFCRATINLSSRESEEVAINLGGAYACKSKIPCFLVVPDCQGVTQSICHGILLTDTEAYAAFVQDVNGLSETAGGGCGLPQSGQGASSNYKATTFIQQAPLTS